MGFEELAVRISPNAPLLPDLVVSTYQVCGVVHLDQLPPAVAVRGRQVSASSTTTRFYRVVPGFPFVAFRVIFPNEIRLPSAFFCPLGISVKP